MEKLKIITNVTVVLSLVLSFSSCKNFSSEEKKSEEKIKMVTKTFDAEFIGNYVYRGLDTLAIKKCADSLFAFRVIVDCKGTSNIIGDINAHFDFCSNGKGNYGNTYAYFIDKSNDTLFVSCEGKVLKGKLEEHPSYVTSYWKDDFVILGGTGRFEGASGKGKTDDYNSSEDINSHHFWKGTITFKKETH